MDKEPLVAPKAALKGIFGNLRLFFGGRRGTNSSYYSLTKLDLELFGSAMSHEHHWAVLQIALSGEPDLVPSEQLRGAGADFVSLPS